MNNEVESTNISTEPVTEAVPTPEDVQTSVPTLPVQPTEEVVQTSVPTLPVQPIEEVVHTEAPAPVVSTPTVQPEIAQPVSAPIIQPEVALVEDKGNIVFIVLGIILPIVGLVLFLMWNKKKDKSAKQAGLGAIIGTALCILSIIGVVVFSKTSKNDEVIESDNSSSNNDSITIEELDDANVDRKGTYGFLVEEKIDNFANLDFSNKLTFNDNYGKVYVDENGIRFTDSNVLDENGVKKEQLIEAENVKSLARNCDCGNCRNIYYLNNKNELYDVQLENDIEIRTPDGSLDSDYIRKIADNIESFTVVDYSLYASTTCSGKEIIAKDKSGNMFIYNSTSVPYKHYKYPISLLQRKYAGNTYSKYFDFYVVNDKSIIKNILKDDKGNDMVVKAIFMQDEYPQLHVYALSKDSLLYSYVIDENNNFNGTLVSNSKVKKYYKEKEYSVEYIFEFEDGSTKKYTSTLTYPKGQ